MGCSDFTETTVRTLALGKKFVSELIALYVYVTSVTFHNEYQSQYTYLAIFDCYKGILIKDTIL